MDVRLVRIPKGADGLTLRVSFRALLVLLLSLAILLVVAGFVGAALRFPALPPATPTPDQPPLSASGSWGEIESFTITLERPDEFVALNGAANTPTRWFFGGIETAEFDGLLRQAGLEAAELRAKLLDPSHREVVTNGFYVTPGSDFVLSLAPEVRARLYSVLARWEENYDQQNPFSFRADAAELWFAHSGLPDATQQLVRRLLYRRGSALCFSDVHEVLGRLDKPADQRRLLKTLSRHAAVLMKLRVRPDSDVDRLIGYWGRGGRAKDLRPLLESLSFLPEGGTIDVVHLLPPFARRRLYTYPYPRADDQPLLMDCHWTSMNFFRENPDDTFFEIGNVVKAIRDDYYPVSGPRAFGDLVFFLTQQGKPVHSCVHVADDVVFTRNGTSFLQPWVLMRLSDLLAVYPSDTPYRIVTYRSKQL
jgi:hypothetical protein